MIHIRGDWEVGLYSECTHIGCTTSLLALIELYVAAVAQNTAAKIGLEKQVIQEEKLFEIQWFENN